MSSVYSTLLVTAHAGAEPSWTVPSGFRAVLRYVTAFNANAISTGSAQIIHTPSSCTVYQRSLDVQEWQGDEMRLVLNEGDELELRTGSDVDMTLSGYLLELP